MDNTMQTEGAIVRQRLAGAALIDQSFRYRLRDDPRAAAESIGIRLTDEQVAEIRRLLRDVDWDAVDALAPLVRAALPRMPQQVAAWG